MTPAMLVSNLVDEIKDATKNYIMEAEYQEDKSISVYAQHIPDAEFENDSFYPLIIVSLESLADSEPNTGRDFSVATIGLTFGVFAEVPNGWRDLLNLMESVRQRVLTKRTIANKYRLILPTKFETIERQPYPFWYGYGTLTYTVAQPQEKLPEYYEDITGDAVNVNAKFI